MAKLHLVCYIGGVVLHACKHACKRKHVPVETADAGQLQTARLQPAVWPVLQFATLDAGAVLHQFALADQLGADRPAAAARLYATVSLHHQDAVQQESTLPQAPEI